MFEVEYIVTIRQEPGAEATIKVTGQCSYGRRASSTTVDVTDAKIIKEASAVCAKALKAVEDDLAGKARAGAAESLVVASRKGEKI